MSVAGIAGTLGFVVPPGALLDLCRSRGALSHITRLLSTFPEPLPEAGALRTLEAVRCNACSAPCRVTAQGVLRFDAGCGTPLTPQRGAVSSLKFIPI